MQFADQFKEVKEAARLAREKSQERFELANPGLNIAAPEVTLSANVKTKTKAFRLKQTEAAPLKKTSQVASTRTSRRCPSRFSSKWTLTQF